MIYGGLEYIENLKKVFGETFLLEDFKEKQVCAHETCTSCNGTGKKKNGDMCIHMISCPCKKCSNIRC